MEESKQYTQIIHNPHQHTQTPTRLTPRTYAKLLSTERVHKVCWNVGEVALKAVAAVVVDKPRHRLKRLFVYDGDFAVGIRFNDDPFANVVAGDSDVNNVLLFVDAEPYEVRASNVRALHQP